MNSPAQTSIVSQSVSAGTFRRNSKTHSNPTMEINSLFPTRNCFAAVAVLAVMLTQFAAPSAFAQTTNYWDNNSTSSGFGTAGGTWASPTVSQWSTDPTGVATPGASITTLLTDVSENFGTAANGLGAGTITVSGAVNAGTNIVFGAASGAITLSGGTSISLPATAAITVSNAADTISTPLLGAATSLAVNGTGMLTLSGGSSYIYPLYTINGSGNLAVTSGWITLNGNINLGGSLSLTNSGTLTYPNGLIVNTGNGVTVTLTGSSISLSGDVGATSANQANAPLVLNTSGVNGPINLNISLSASGHDYNTGPVTANAGTGQINITGTGPTSQGWGGYGGCPVTLDGAVNISGNIVTINGTTGNHVPTTLTINPNGTTSGSISGVLSGPTTLTVGSTGAAGTVTISSASTYTGATTVSGGTLALGNGGATGSLSTSSAISVGTGATFAVNRNNAVAQGTDFTGSAITGAGGFTQAGSGTTTLTNKNTYTGATTISAGTLALGVNGSISNSTSISLAAGGTLDVSAISAYAVSSANTITASGTGTAAAIKGNASGTVDLGVNNITLNYDGSHPALVVSQGTIKLEGNLWTINGATLSSTPNTYVIAHQASGSINATGTATVNVYGTAVAGLAVHIAISGGDVQLVVDGTSTALTVNGLTANNKVYDGTTAATINTNGYTLSTVAPADVGLVYLVTNGYTATFADANVGVGKTVTVSGLSLGGSKAEYYYVTQPITLTANISNAITTNVLSCVNSNVYSGRPYVFLASLSILSGGWPTTGTVTFTTNGVTLGTANVNSSGVAPLLATLPPGNYTITAGYPSTANVIGSTNTLTIALGTNSLSGWVWDANTSLPGAQDGSGTWNTANTNWWNGTTDIAWDSTSAVFGGGVDGAYNVNLANNVTVNSLYFNNSGYSIATANSSQINLAGGTPVTVAGNKTATVNCNISGPNNFDTFTVNTGSTLNVGGNINGLQFHPTGGGIINLSGTNAPTVWEVDSSINLINGGVWSGPSGSYGWLGYSAGANVNFVVTNASMFINYGVLAIANNNAGTSGTLIIQNNGLVNFGSGINLWIADNGAANCHGTVDMQGGKLALANSPIIMMGASGAAGQTAIFTQEGGTITAGGGIQFGAASGAYAASCTNSYTMTGGSLYLGSSGFNLGAAHPTYNFVTLSGGTVGALANWPTVIPITLGTANGNVTFQCADTNANPYNITLSGGLNGSGGFNVTGSGTLTLGGTLNYAGSTVVSNGTLAVTTTGTPIVSGAVTLDGSAGSPTVSLTATVGQYWTNSALSFINGTTTLAFNFGALPPSNNGAPIQVVGNVAFTATPTINISGSAIGVGTYPLVKYTGSVSGTMPTTATILPSEVTAAYITNNATTKTIALVVTGSTYNAALYWAVGNAAWDVNSSSNWKSNSISVKYGDPDAVVFDDSASGSSPITVTLNTSVNPYIITANNNTKSYTITGSGTIAGTAALSLLNAGMLTLASTNAYSGGTTVSAGQLNINNGGDNSGNNSAIGTGPLTLAAGVALDNTSGFNVSLVPTIAEIWNGSFTYLGSSNSLNMGVGAVAMKQSMILTVSSNTFTVGGSITDSGNSTLTKAGSGTLTLGAANSINQGVTLSAGQLNLGNSGSIGSGTFEVDGGLVDNVSGSDMTVSPGEITWAGSFRYLGFANSLDLGGAAVSIPANINVTVVSNTLTTEGDINAGNNTLTKNGGGTLSIIGSNNDHLAMVVNAGTVNLGKSSGYAINLSSSSNRGLTVNTNGLVVITVAGNSQIAHGGSPTTPVTLNGGILDLNGNASTIVDSLLITNSGTLRNSAGFPTLRVGSVGNYTLILGGTNCTFDVPAASPAAGELDISAVVAGNGSLLKTGGGLLNLYSNITYTGSTIVNGGELTINYPSLATNSLVSVTNGAMLYLNFATTNTVGGLVLGGVVAAAGVHNATTDPSYFDPSGAGSLLVPSSVPPINPYPGTIQVGVSGSSLALSWPTNSGWILQTQTNSLNIGLGTNWVDVPGSSSTTSTNITINPANPTMFFRLRSP